jgi:release factor glutamine methyltransferase
MDIGDHLRRAAGLLAEAGCDAPRLDAEVLLGHSLSLNRAQVYARWYESLSTAQVQEYEGLLQRRLRREPLAYIVGHKEFFGLDFYVDRRVLIPRPETELLIEQAIAVARRLAPAVALRVADVGTGSGAIAVSLAVSLPAAYVYAVDASPEALEVAAENVRRHGVAARVQLLRGDLLAALPDPVDVVVANLPYISQAEWATLAPEIRLFEPVSALAGGPEGLDLIRQLLTQAAGQTKPPRAILLEIGAMQGNKVLDLAHRIFGEAQASLLPDYAGLDRIVMVEL